MGEFEPNDEQHWRGCFQWMELKVELDLVLVLKFQGDGVDYVLIEFRMSHYAGFQMRNC